MKSWRDRERERDIVVRFKRADDDFVLSHRLGTPVKFKKTFLTTLINTVKDRIR